MNFVAIDFETAKQHHICAVGIVTVENSQIVDEYYTLVQPPYNEYNWHTIQVHGIQPQDTEDAPIFPDIYDEVYRRLKGKVVVAHNESFDRNVLRKTLEDYRLTAEDLDLTKRWDCTMRRARKAKYASSKLNECCKIHNIELNHHEALSDARACALLLIELENAGNGTFDF